MTLKAIDFAHRLAAATNLTETKMAISVAWFQTVIEGADSTSVPEIANFIEEHSIRTSLNRTRLKSRLKKDTTISCRKDGKVTVPLKTQQLLNETYADLLAPPPPAIEDTILELVDFTSARKYVISLARQINGTYQFECYDACAVMMRRLMEVLIIDAYEAKGQSAKIKDDKGYMQLSNLIGAIGSKQDFPLSRNAGKWMDTCKKLGDNAAHSRTYQTKKLDIDDIKVDYRNLISELQSYQ
ncbi:DUF4145 domain-containing protein [Halocynthiibacter sp. C4]|uniref:DUF4145 domain-containing protein n=1 Tax=Halocynthiibacter sp. C4 TaxID=2992758 RepID=UPI00237B3233|nr:DUF4145 domain-containing protein [Halocynthiibacter sp. C4]MDE0590475.1 DUF4145 domain-containing protein [Halocynthiibacter sp. C4]